MELAKDRVSANLRRMAAHGINYKDPDHVSAYLLLRQTHERPRPEQILAALKTSKVLSTSGCQLSTESYLVLKDNVGTPIPDWVQEWGVSEEDVRENYQVPEETNFKKWYIIDCACPREQLGKGVKKIAFKEAFTRSLSTADPAAVPAAAALAETAAAAPVVTAAAAPVVTAAAAPVVT